VLVDGLGNWIAGALHRAGAFDGADEAQRETASERILQEIDRVAQAAAGADPVIVVAEDASHGVLPPDPSSRLWLDLLGTATQRLAAAADHVELVIAGRPLALSASGGVEAVHTEGGCVEKPVIITGNSTHPPPPEVGLGGDRFHTTLRQHGDAEVRPGDADHAVNVLAGGPPAWLREVLEQALATADRYPDEQPAVTALAQRHGRSPDEVVPTNGAAEALWLLPAALRPRLAACLHPGFTESEAALHAHGVPVARVIRDPDRDFALDADAVPDDADLVIVGNPASPSGTLAPSTAVLALRRPGRVVVVDEAFMDLVPGEPGTLAGEALADVIVIRSLTKVLAVPGLRAGYALAPAPLAERLRVVRPAWSANTLALAVLAAAAERPDALALAAQRAAAERIDLSERLTALPGVRCWPSATNFCLIEVADGPAVIAALRARRFAVRPAASFPGLGPGHLRITARSPEQNARVVEALAEAVAACA
jgi:histidinol-phosphate/aromatic aminotransferase/cobyric acid decarboxylase-like protein